MASKRPIDIHAACRYIVPAMLMTLAACTVSAPVVPEPATAVPAATLTPEEADYRLLSGEAEAGNANSQLLLAEMLLAGKGTARDIGKAHAWLEKAAAMEYPPALDLLSTLHYRGIGVAVDYGKAKALMERAAERRYLPAINNLAWFLSTCPDASVRDGKRAVALLEPVMDQSPQLQDTLAAAYAENGDFDRASTLQNQAIIALGNVQDPRLPAFIERMAAYARGQPWRDPPAGAPATASE